jgi:MFS family permease
VKGIPRNLDKNQKILSKFEFFNNLDTGVMKIIIPVIIIKLGISIGVFGLALSIKPFLKLILRYAVGRLSDQFGRKTIAILGQISAAIALLGYTFMNNSYHYILTEVFRAFSLVIFESAYIAWKKESCNDEERVDFVMKLSRSRTFGIAVGGFFVVLIFFLINNFNLRIFGIEVQEQHFFLIFFLLELFTAVYLFRMKETAPKKTETSQVSLKDSIYYWRGYLFMLYNAFSIGLTGAIALPFTTAYITEKMKLPMDKLGISFAVSSVIAVLIAQRLARSIKYFRPFKTIGVLLSFAGAASLLIPLANGLYLFIAIWSVYQVFETLVSVINSTQEQRLIKANTSQVLQSFSTFSSVGTVLGSNLGGVIWVSHGSTYTYWIASLLIFLLGLSQLIYNLVSKESEFSDSANLKQVRTENP